MLPTSPRVTMKIDPLETARLLNASETVQAAHRRFTPTARVSTDDRDKNSGERLHPKVANWRSGP
jgi:hypothetical protein